MVKTILHHPILKGTLWVFQSSLQILLFILLPIVIFTTITSKTDYIDGLKSFVVLTGSMEPTLPVGSVIYTKESLGYSPHDIIAFKNDADQTVTHRIADISYQEQTLYTTKGDANKVLDNTPVTTDKVVGKVYFHIPYVGYIINFLRTTQGFILLIIVPSFLFIGMELWNIKKEMEKEIEKKMLKKLRASQQINENMSFRT